MEMVRDISGKSTVSWLRLFFYFFIYLFDSDHKGPYANTHKIHTRSTVKNKIKF